MTDWLSFDIGRLPTGFLSDGFETLHDMDYRLILYGSPIQGEPDGLIDIFNMDAMYPTKRGAVGERAAYGDVDDPMVFQEMFEDAVTNNDIDVDLDTGWAPHPSAYGGECPE